MNGDIAPNAIDLAHEAPFELGDLQVRPSTREVATGDQSQVLEPRVMQVLVALARRRGTVVSRQDLFTTCWGGRTVGEESINRCIAAIRRLAEAHGGFSITTVARVGYRLDAAATDPDPPIHSVPAAAASAEPLLAVLAFDNLSGDPEMAWFSDGVSEEIQQTVARSVDLKVIGRTSSFQFRGPEKVVRRVAEELNVTHVLDGAVRRSGPRARVSAQLIECAGQTTLWSDQFDRELSDVFALQDEIAAAVAAALKIQFAQTLRTETVDPAAYDLYLKARARVGAFGPEKVFQTLNMLERVVAAAPRFARAWSSLAACRANLLRFHGEAARECGLTREAARTAAETALSLDPALGRPYVALSLLEAWASLEEREALLRKALVVAPNDPISLTSMALFFGDVGRRRDATESAKKAYDLDPLDFDAEVAYSSFIDPYDRKILERFCERWPDNDTIAFNAIGIAAQFGDWEGFDSFVAASRLRITTDPDFRALVWHGRNLRNPYPQSIMRAFEQARQELSRTGTLPLGGLSSLSQLGMTEEVFDLIGRASFAHVFDEAGPAPSGIVHPGVIFNRSNMAMIRDIRFVGLCAKLGLCAYWLKTDHWPDCVDEVDYDFKAEARRLAAANAADGREP